MEYVSRAGQKLEHAFKIVNFNPVGLVCADFGSSSGGFVDCLLRHGVERVYAVEKGYGVLDWKLRTDKKVVVLEKTNAMYVTLPEKMDFISVDTGWTRLKNIMPNVLNNLKENGHIIALIKPHYEAKRHMLHKGKVKEEFVLDIVKETVEKLKKLNILVLSLVESPVLGSKGKNKEFLVYMSKDGSTH